MECREADQIFTVPIGWIVTSLQILLRFILHHQTLK